MLTSISCDVFYPLVFFPPPLGNLLENDVTNLHPNDESLELPYEVSLGTFEYNLTTERCKEIHVIYYKVH